MAESRASEDVLWVRPHERGILPLDKFHVPKRLARVVRSNKFQITADAAFEDVIRACAESRPDRRETWINDAIIDAFVSLHERGFAHSIETWHQGKLVGGLYGLSLGGAFFAESKFSRATDASKVALVHVAARLKAGGYTLLDAQFPNPHLEQFGAATVTEERFQFMLSQALSRTGNFYGLGPPGTAAGAVGAPVAGGGVAISADVVAAAGAGSSVLHVITHTS